MTHNSLPIEAVTEVFLQPGDFYFGKGHTRVKTILGSCVAITLWHPRAKIGGMCHYMLPKRSEHSFCTKLDGRYADEALQLFMLELKKTASHPADYEVKMFGGGNQFPTRCQTNDLSIPDNNIRAGKNLLRLHGFTTKAVHLGSTGHRSIVFELWNGNVWLKHTVFEPSVFS